MKKQCIVFIGIAALLTINASVVQQKQSDSAKVKDQYSNDIKRKEAIQKKIYDLMKEINEHAGGATLIVPVDPEKADNVVDHDEYQKKEADKKKAGDKKTDDAALIAPTKGKTTSKYGYRQNPVTKKYAFHKGIDIAAPKGTKVVASAGGVVATSNYLNNGYGNCVIIEHANNVKTLYAHLDQRIVAAGDTVIQGQKIGTVGATGRATGPHLHYEVYKGGKSINPEELVHY